METCPNAGEGFTAVGDALRRSRTYSLFSRAFRHPKREHVLAFASRYLPELRVLLDGVPGCLEELPAGYVPPLTPEDEGELETAYIALFDVGVPEPPCPPYEGAHRTDMERTPVLLEVSEFYRHFGLAIRDEDGAREPADHLRAELEFMHFLCFREAQAAGVGVTEATAAFRRAQKDFLDRHLCEWIPSFAGKVGEHGSDFYPGLASALAKFVTHEAARY